MSFTQNGITFYTPGDQQEQPITNMDGVISYLGDSEYRSPKSGFKLVGTYESELRNPDPFGRVQVDYLGRVWLESAGYLYVYGSQARFYTDGGSISSQPPGNGTVFISDGFVEWSMARLKKSIAPIPDKARKKPLNPRRFTVAGKTRYGFVAELSPDEVVYTVINPDTGKEEKGIDVLAICALQQAKIDTLEKRIALLEKRVGI